MSSTRTTLSRSHFWVLLRIPPTSSANPRIRSVREGISPHQFVSSFHTSISSKPISRFLCKSIPFGSCIVRILPEITILGFLRNPIFFTHRLISSSSNQQSFTVSYLINSIGLSPKAALSASKYVNFKSPEKPDKVVDLFRSYGFTRTQISSLVRVFPAVLVSDTEKTIFPKLEFLKAKGISGPDMAKKLCLFPTLLKSSLVKQIMPSYDFYRNLFQSDGKVVAVVKRYPDVLTFSLKKYVSPNIDILRRHGVPDAKICILMLNWPICVMATHDRFQKVLKKVEDMGFHASKLNFVLAVVALRTRDESKWQSKVDAYKKWGCSEEDVLKAFHRFPWCMMISENKLMAGMDFFINQMGLRPCFIVKHSRLLSQSLKKRIIPRFSVFKVLLSKGLMKKDVSLRQLFQVSDKKFLQNFITPYEEEAPELLKLYKEKMNLSNGPLVDKV